MQSERPRLAGLRSTVPALLILALLAGIGAVRNPGGPVADAKEPAAAPANDADLALVPADAVAFAHVRLADVWKSELMSSFRTSFERAGPKALAALEEQLVPSPSTFDRFTVFVTFSEHGVSPVGLLSFTKPVDAQQLVKTYFPRHEKKTIAGKTLYVCDCGGEAYFPSDRQGMIGTSGAPEQYLARPVAAEGNMRAAIERAATKRGVVAANLAALPIPPQAFADVPPDLVPLLRAQTV